MCQQPVRGLDVSAATDSRDRWQHPQRGSGDRVLPGGNPGQRQVSQSTAQATSHAGTATSRAEWRGLSHLAFSTGECRTEGEERPIMRGEAPARLRGPLKEQRAVQPPVEGRKEGECVQGAMRCGSDEVDTAAQPPMGLWGGPRLFAPARVQALCMPAHSRPRTLGRRGREPCAPLPPCFQKRSPLSLSVCRKKTVLPS